MRVAAAAQTGETLTQGANHYVNLKTVVVRPVWYDPSRVVVKIGDHTFLKL